MMAIPNDKTDSCYLCGCIGRMHKHHMLHGAYRAAADKYGLTVHLCPWCHMALHDRGFCDKYLQRMAQQYFEAEYGHEEFVRVFGKNFDVED